MKPRAIVKRSSTINVATGSLRELRRERPASGSSNLANSEREAPSIASSRSREITGVDFLAQTFAKTSAQNNKVGEANFVAGGGNSRLASGASVHFKPDSKTITSTNNNNNLNHNHNKMTQAFQCPAAQFTPLAQLQSQHAQVEQLNFNGAPIWGHHQTGNSNSLESRRNKKRNSSLSGPAKSKHPESSQSLRFNCQIQYRIVTPFIFSPSSRPNPRNASTSDRAP